MIRYTKAYQQSRRLSTLRWAILRVASEGAFELASELKMSETPLAGVSSGRLLSVMLLDCDPEPSGAGDKYRRGLENHNTREAADI